MSAMIPNRRMPEFDAEIERLEAHARRRAAAARKGISGMTTPQIRSAIRGAAQAFQLIAEAKHLSDAQRDAVTGRLRGVICNGTDALIARIG